MLEFLLLLCRANPCVRVLVTLRASRLDHLFWEHDYMWVLVYLDVIQLLSFSFYKFCWYVHVFRSAFHSLCCIQETNIGICNQSAMYTFLHIYKGAHRASSSGQTITCGMNFKRISTVITFHPNFCLAMNSEKIVDREIPALPSRQFHVVVQ